MDTSGPPESPPPSREAYNSVPDLSGTSIVLTVSAVAYRLTPVLYRGPGFWITEVPWIM